MNIFEKFNSLKKLSVEKKEESELRKEGESKLMEIDEINGRKVREEMPIELKEELSKAIFEGIRDEGHSSTGSFKIKEIGLRKACERVSEEVSNLSVTGGIDYYDTISVILRYKNGDTEATVGANGNYVTPSIHIKNKDKEYHWIGTIPEDEIF